MANMRRHARSKGSGGVSRMSQIFLRFPGADPWILADRARLLPCWASTSCCGSPSCEAPAAFLRSQGPQGRGGGRRARRRPPRRSWRARPAPKCASLPAVVGGRPARRCRGLRRRRGLERDTAAQRLAKSVGVPVNVADRPELCDSSCPRSSIATASWWRSRPAARRPPWPATCAAVSRPRCRSASAPGAARQDLPAQANAVVPDPARRRGFWRRLIVGPAARLVARR